MVCQDERRNMGRFYSYRAVLNQRLCRVNTLTQRPKTPAEELLSKVRGMTDEEKAAKEKEDSEVMSNAILNHQTNSIEQVLVHIDEQNRVSLSAEILDTAPRYRLMSPHWRYLLAVSPLRSRV